MVERFQMLFVRHLVFRNIITNNITPSIFITTIELHYHQIFSQEIVYLKNSGGRPSTKKFKLKMNHKEEPKGQNIQEEEEFQIFAEDHSSSPEDLYFDEVVGALQDIMVEEEFENIQNHFMNKYCAVFEETEENKFQYTEIFNLYQKEIQVFVSKSLAQRVSEFQMPKFLHLLESRTEQIDQLILDMIQSFTEFTTFKKLMLEHRAFMLNEGNLQSLTIKSKGLS